MSETQVRNRRIWTAALRSGKFTQTREKLGDVEGGMCCLGVGCYVLGIPYNPIDAFPPKAFVDAVGLGIVDSVDETDFNGEFAEGSLVNLNDVEGMSFPEIATVIDNNPSLWAGSDYQEARIAAYEEEKEEWGALHDPPCMPLVVPLGDEDDGA